VTAKFLNDRERLIAIERLRSNRTGVKNTHHKKHQVKEAFIDLKVWLLVAAIFFHNMTNPLQTSFSGLITRGLGYSKFQSILLSIPPGIVQGTSMLLAGFFLATKWGQQKRIFIIIACYCPAVAACLILFLSPIKDSTRSAHLFAIIIVPVAAVSAGLMYSLLASNIAGYTKKATTGSMFFMAYAVANIVGPQCFLSSQAPRYQTGIAACLASFALVIIIFIVLYFVYRASNARRDADPAGVADDETNTEELIDAFSDKTDLENRKLRYKL
jgi:ACS family allantoate permease-like MFS transporter